MKLTMMSSAQRHSELIAHLAPECTVLRDAGRAGVAARDSNAPPVPFAGKMSVGAAAFKEFEREFAPDPQSQKLKRESSGRLENRDGCSDGREGIGCGRRSGGTPKRSTRIRHG